LSSFSTFSLPAEDCTSIRIRFRMPAEMPSLYSCSRVSGSSPRSMTALSPLSFPLWIAE
jgi:hypothetical protein